MLLRRFGHGNCLFPCRKNGMMRIVVLFVALTFGVAAFGGNFQKNSPELLAEYTALPAENRLPSAVIDAVVKNFPGYSMQKVSEKRSQDGTVSYELTLRNISGTEITVTFYPDGKLKI